MTSEDEASGKFEQILESVGSDGKYQQLLLWLFLGPLNFFISWIALAPILLVSVPDHWCNVPGKPAEIQMDQWVNMTVPREMDGSLSQCLQYNTSQLSLPSEQRQNFSCQGSMSYSTVDYSATLATRHSWVCGDAAIVAQWQSVGLVGNVVGPIIFNPLSDVFGRRLLFVVSAVVQCVMSVVRVLVDSHWLLMVTQFLASLAFPTVLQVPIVLVNELVNSKWRSRVISVGFTFWSLGTCGLALAAYLARTDTILSVIISVPFAIYLPAAWWLPESPRWLLTRGRVDEAASILKTVARVNSVKAPDDLVAKLKDTALVKGSRYGALDLIKTPVLGFRTFILCICCILNKLVYYGLSYNATNLNGNIFVNFFLLGITEVPSNFVGWWISLNVGRRWSQSIAFFLSATTLSFALVAGENAPVWLSTTLLIVGKFFIAVSFLVVYIQMAELYPTSHCSSGIGVASVAASSIAVVIPYIAYSADVWWGLPYVIFQVMGFSGFFVSSFLPETSGAAIPQSPEEAENLLLGETYFSYKGKKFWRCNAEPEVNEINYSNNERGAVNRETGPLNSGRGVVNYGFH